MVYEFETFCGVSTYHLAALVQKKMQKKIFRTPYLTPSVERVEKKWIDMDL